MAREAGRVMTEKPQMKKEVALSDVGEITRSIWFYATPDAAEELREFGHIESMATNNQYRLIVDARFDFGEVVNYIVNYGKD